jgi:PKD repeat protein
MKKLILLLLLIISFTSIAEAEDSRWIKKGAFWEFPDSISNIQFSLDGDYFFVLDSVNYKFLKYKTETGILEKTYDIQIPESIDKTSIQIYLSPDLKIYSVSSIFKIKRNSAFEPIVYFYNLEDNNLIFSRNKRNYGGYTQDEPYGNGLRDIKFPSVAIVVDSLLIYTGSKVYAHSGGQYGWIEEFSGLSTVVNLNTGDSINYDFGFTNYFYEKNYQRLIFKTFYRYFQPYINSDYSYYKIYAVRRDNLIDSVFCEYGGNQVQFSKNGNIFSFLIPRKLVYFDLSKQLGYRYDKMVDSTLSHFCYINDKYFAASNFGLKKHLWIYNLDNPEYIDYFKLGDSIRDIQLYQHPDKSEVYIILDKNKLIKFDLKKFDGIVPSFSAKTKIIPEKSECEFINYSTGDPDRYLWDFGDGKVTTEFKPSHFYNNPGEYSIKLTAYKGTDSSVSFRENYIKVLPSIKADFEIKQLSGLDTLKVISKNLSTGTIIKYKWIIGSKTFSDKDVDFTIYKPGFYDVTLIVSDSTFSDTLTKVDYISIIQSPIQTDFVAHHSSFSNDTANYYPASFNENNNKYYISGYYHEKRNGYLYNNLSIFEITQDFQDSQLKIEDSYYGTYPNQIFVNKKNQAVISSFDSGYLNYYDFNENKKVKYEYPTESTKLFIDNNLCYNFGWTRDIYAYYFKIQKYNEDFTYNNVLNLTLTTNLSKYMNSVRYVINKEFTLMFLSYIVEKDIGSFGHPAFQYSIYYSIYQINFKQNSQFTEVKNHNEKIITLDYFNDNFNKIYDYSIFKNKAVNINDTRIIRKNLVVCLLSNNRIIIYQKDSSNVTEVCMDSLNASCLFPYNDSLFLAGGSINGKATLFFLSTEDLEIKKVITLNSLYGNITSIERASDGEFLLLAENKINKKFYSFLAIKTKNLGKDAYPVSVDLGNETPKIDFSNLGRYLQSNSLTIDYTYESTNPTLEIYDFMGRKLVSTNVLDIDSKTKQVTCDLSQFGNEITERAIYFYILRDSGNVLRGKFMR